MALDAMTPGFDHVVKLMEAGKSAEAEAACRQMLRVNPKDPTALILGGRIAAAAGDKATAQTRLRAVAFDEAAEVPLRHRAAGLLFDLKDLNGASLTLRALAKLQPYSFAILTDLGWIETALGRYAAALAAYDAAAALDPSHAGIQTRRGVLMLRQALGDPLPMPPDKRQAPDLSLRIMMSTLGTNGRFGDQFFQYAFLRCYGEVHRLKAEVPKWVGRWLFDLDDPYPGAPLPELADEDHRLLRSLAGTEPEVFVGRDFRGVFRGHTSGYRPHRDLIRTLYRAGELIRRYGEGMMEKLRHRGRTLVALHLRRGDYGRGRGWVAPEAWYLEWLAAVWPTLDAPILYVASDEPGIFQAFAKYNPIRADDLGRPLPGAEFFGDFHVMTQADLLAISNSSFSFAASMLNRNARTFLRPHPRERGLVPFDPWDAEVLLERSVMR